MKKIIFSMILTMAIISYGSVAGALQYSGSLSSSSGITAASEWASGVSLSWVVDNTTNPGFWTYKYTWQDTYGTPKDLSHIIIELSPNATNIQVTFAPNATGTSLIGTYSSANGNPGMPGSMYGIKVTPTEPKPNPYEFSLITVRAPVWGDFYAKDGSTNQLENTAWNAGFLADDPNAAPANGSLDNHILRPDTQGSTLVPEPATMILLGLGLLGLGIAVRKRS